MCIFTSEIPNYCSIGSINNAITSPRQSFVDEKITFTSGYGFEFEYPNYGTKKSSICRSVHWERNLIPSVKGK